MLCDGPPFNKLVSNSIFKLSHNVGSESLICKLLHIFHLILSVNKLLTLVSKDPEDDLLG